MPEIISMQILALTAITAVFHINLFQSHRRENIGQGHWVKKCAGRVCKGHYYAKFDIDTIM